MRIFLFYFMFFLFTVKPEVCVVRVRRDLHKGKMKYETKCEAKKIKM